MGPQIGGGGCDVTNRTLGQVLAVRGFLQRLSRVVLTSPFICTLHGCRDVFESRFSPLDCHDWQHHWQHQDPILMSSHHQDQLHPFTTVTHLYLSWELYYVLPICPCCTRFPGKRAEEVSTAYTRPDLSTRCRLWPGHLCTFLSLCN